MRALIVALVIAAGGCASAPPNPDAPHTAEAFGIAPYGIHETCFRLAAGDRLDWRFESNAAVEFNLHYHDGPIVVMPLTFIASTGASGIFPVTVAQDYCAMWEAGAAGAVVSYHIRPLRAER
ncbi:MAG: hypothetical protein ABI585_03930 [Betaproteobacteria bacterium]